MTAPPSAERVRARHKRRAVPTVARVTPTDPAVPATSQVNVRVMREVAGLVMMLLGVSTLFVALILISPLAAAVFGGGAVFAGGLYLAQGKV